MEITKKDNLQFLNKAISKIRPDSEFKPFSHLLPKTAI